MVAVEWNGAGSDPWRERPMTEDALDPELLEILACPETKEPVELASAELVSRLNQKIQAGELTNRGGRLIQDPVTNLLVRQDGKVAFLVRDGIPIMLIEESIEL